MISEKARTSRDHGRAQLAEPGYSVEPQGGDARLSPRGLSDVPTRWVDGGPISDWAPVHSRHAKPIAVRGHQPARFVITKIANPPDDPVILRWMEHQRLLVEPAIPPTATNLFFWRLAIRLRSFAIDAHPRDDLEITLERVRRLSQRAGSLRVTFGFMTGQPIPSWVVRDGDEPVFVGMPDHHLVPTPNPSSSVAAMVAVARIKPRIHDLSRQSTEPHPRPTAKPSKKLAPDSAPPVRDS